MDSRWHKRQWHYKFYRVGWQGYNDQFSSKNGWSTPHNDHSQSSSSLGLDWWPQQLTSNMRLPSVCSHQSSSSTPQSASYRFCRYRTLDCMYWLIGSIGYHTVSRWYLAAGSNSRPFPPFLPHSCCLLACMKGYTACMRLLGRLGRSWEVGLCRLRICWCSIQEHILCTRLLLRFGSWDPHTSMLVHQEAVYTYLGIMNMCPRQRPCKKGLCTSHSHGPMNTRPHRLGSAHWWGCSYLLCRAQIPVHKLSHPYSSPGNRTDSWLDQHYQLSHN